jgi:hypothetical protein
MYTKYAGAKGGQWSNEHTNGNYDSPYKGHLFVWGIDTGHSSNGRHLIFMRDVDIVGGDGQITEGVNDLDRA